MVDSVAIFDLPSVARGPKLTEADLKAVASKLQQALRRRGFAIGDLYGSSRDLWGSSVEFDRYDILFSVSPDQRFDPDRWSINILLDDPGWFKSTRSSRLADMKRVELGLHDALTSELGARNIEWLLGTGNVDKRQKQPRP